MHDLTIMGLARCMVWITAWQGTGVSFATICSALVTFWTIVILTS